MTKILVPTDFSPGSQKAMRVAIRIAHETGAELVIVHAWYVPPLAFGTRSLRWWSQPVRERDGKAYPAVG